MIHLNYPDNSPQPTAQPFLLHQGTMSTTVSVPRIEKYSQIGTLPNKTPITFDDLTFMTDYNASRIFPVRDKSESKTTGLTTVTEVVITPDGWKDLSPPSGAIKGTVGSVEMNKLIIEYFHKNVWEGAKSSFPEQDKWKLFGYFMTDYARKCLGSAAWNQNSLYYWSAVAATLRG